VTGPARDGQTRDWQGGRGERELASQRSAAQRESAQLGPHGEGELAARLRAEALSLFGRSLHIRTVDTGSCAVCESELRLLAAPHYDLHRLGFFFTPAPRHADLLMVTGPAIRAADNLLLRAFEAIPDPKVVVAVGACALGGVFGEDQLVHGAVDRVLPVDVYIPGCPPSPIALLQGLLVAVGRLRERVSGLSLDLDAKHEGGGQRVEPASSLRGDGA
jgi:Ni,Fe-hydrogenase III small subunit